MKFVSLFLIAFLSSAAASSIDDFDNLAQDHDSVLRGFEDRNLGKTPKDYCVQVEDKDGIQRWESQSLTKDELKGLKAEKGLCQRICEDICDHQPCFDDFEVVNTNECLCYDRDEDTCGPNSSCKRDKCVCDKSFFYDEDLEVCRCPDYSSPVDGKCVCDGDAFWNKKTGTCDCDEGLVRIDGDCVCEDPDQEYNGKRCVCRGDLIEDDEGVCGCPPGFTEEEGYTCACDGDSGFREDDDGKCVCKVGAAPEDGVCECTFGFKVVKDPTKDCVCLDGSNDDEEAGVCECDETYERGLDGLCQCPFGATNGGDFTAPCECDEANGFVEDGEGGCECRIGSNYDGASESCICEGFYTGDSKKACECVDDNAEPDETGECLCSPTFVRDGDTCICGFGATGNTCKCDKDRGFRDFGDAGCDCRENSVHVPLENRCVCSEGFEDEGGECVCPGNSELVDGLCTCPEGYIEDEEEGCVCRFGAEPDKDDICICGDSFITDEEGVCSCHISTVYDNGKCKCKPGLKSTGDNTCEECNDPNGTYDPENGTCKCNDRYMNVGGACECIWGGDMKDNCACDADRLFTDSEDGESCECIIGAEYDPEDDECKCGFGFEYDKKTGQCVCVAGSNDDKNRGECKCNEGWVRNDPDGLCECQLRSNDDDDDGVCECDDGYVRNKKGECACPTGASPDDDGNCVCSIALGFDPEPIEDECICGFGSKLHNNRARCVCSDGFVKDKMNGGCKCPVGSLDPTPRNDVDRCSCDTDNGFVATEDGDCVCDVGRTNDKDEDVCACDTNAGFIADGDDCICPDNEELSKNGKKCVCMEGFIRDSEGDCVCPFGSFKYEEGVCMCKDTFVLDDKKGCICRGSAEYDPDTDRCECYLPSVQNEDDEDGACVCPNGFGPNKKGDCVPV